MISFYRKRKSVNLLVNFQLNNKLVSAWLIGSKCRLVHSRMLKKR